MALLKHSKIERLPEITKQIIPIKPEALLDPDAPLAKKSARPDILAKLIELEQEIIAKAKAQKVI